MRNLGLILVSLILTSAADAQVTKVATFENFSEGQSFKPSFTDSSTGVLFHDSTDLGGGFSIEYSTTVFGSTYLTAGGFSPGPPGALAADFGFMADMPTAANHVSVDVFGFGNTALVSLTGFKSGGRTVAQEFGSANAVNPFTLEINSAQFDITRFQIQVPAGYSSGYDNISFTILPEPGIALCALAQGVLLRRRRR